jgi:hypothetical protein
MDGQPCAGAMRSVACAAVVCALLLVGCTSDAGSGASGGSPGFNVGGPMEVHSSPTEAAGEQIRVPDVKGEDWEDAAHAVLDAGFEFGNVVAGRGPPSPVVGDLPVAAGRFAPRAG